MASIRRIPGDTARRQKLRRFKLDFRTLLDGAPYDISDWEDVRIDVFDTNREVIVTWSTENYLERPATDRLLIDQELPDDVELTEAGQYLLDIYQVTSAGADSFASMTLYLDEILTSDYQNAVDGEVIFIKFSSTAPGTTLETSSLLSSRVESLEMQVAASEELVLGAVTDAQQAAAEALGYLEEQKDAGINWRGAWEPDTNYVVGDGVSNGGNSYRRKTTGVSGSSFDSENWDLLAQGGSVADETISPEKTTFFSLGKNLFNKAASTGNEPEKYVNASNGNIDTNVAYTASHPIAVTPGTWYFPTFKHQMAWYNAGGGFISGEIAGRTNNQVLAPAGAATARFTVDNIDTFMVEVGTAFTFYEQYGKKIDQVFLRFADGALLGRFLSPLTLTTGLYMDGSITNPKVADRAISISKTNFFAPGTNKFDISNSGNETGKYIENTGVILTNAGYNLTYYIPVSPSTWYYPSLKNRIAYFSTPEPAGYISGEPHDRANQKFQTPSGCNYIRCSVTVAAWNAFMINEGEVPAGDFQAFKWVLTPGATATPTRDSVGADQVIDHSLSITKNNWIGTGKNLFNYRTVNPLDEGYYLNEAGGRFAGSTYCISDFQEVTPGLKYSGRDSTGNGMRFTTYYDAGKNWVSGGASTSAAPFLLTTAVIPVGVKYIRFTFLLANKLSFQFEQADAPTTPILYHLKAVTPEGIPVASSIVTPESVIDHSLSITKNNWIGIGKNLFNYRTVNPLDEGYYLNEAGARLANAIYSISDFQEVTPGLKYSGRDATGQGMRFTTYYDAGKNWVAGGVSTSAAPFLLTTAVIPVGVKYIRFTFLLANKLTFQFEQADAPTTPVPYHLKAVTPEGIPVAATLVTPELITPIIEAFTEPYGLTVAPKMYVPVGKEVGVYSENIHKNFSPYRDKTDVSISGTGARKTGRGGKFQPSAVGTTSGLVTVGDKKFDVLTTKGFQVIATNPALTTALKIQIFGDSYTRRGTFVNQLIAGAGTGITFLGIRNSAASTGNVACEGRGGWTLAQYVTLSKTIYTPFVQPLTGSYLYLGNTTFWINANAGYPDTTDTPGYEHNFFNVAGQFNPSTGYPTAPRTNDVIYDNTANAFKYWDGSAWIDITEAALNFGLSYAKYRQCWSIAQPDVFHPMLGTNDFATATETTFPALYATFKTRYDALFASVRADSPLVKIAIGIPVSSGRQGEFGTYETERRKRAYWLLANALIADYANREGELLYLADYHSTVDRVYGYDNTDEKPFSDFSGTARDQYKADFTHISVDGFKQMGNSFYGLIQSFR